MSARFLALHALLALGIFRVGLAQDADAEKFAPEGYKISRYEQIWKAQPFIKETVVQAPTVSPLAGKYRLVGLVQAGNESVVFLADTAADDPAKGRIILSQSRPDKVRNLELVSVASNKDMRKSMVKIKQGAETADLPFDPGTLTNAGIGVQAAGMMPGQQPGNIMPPQPSLGAVPMPGVPPPQPGQINPNPQDSPTVAPNGEQVPPNPTRRIIRPKPINVN